MALTQTELAALVTTVAGADFRDCAWAVNRPPLTCKIDIAEAAVETLLWPGARRPTLDLARGFNQAGWLAVRQPAHTLPRSLSKTPAAPNSP